MEPQTGIEATQLESATCMPGDGDAETDVEVLKEVPRGFSIDCEQHANWLVKKVVAARMYSERVKQWAEQEQRRAAREERTLLFLFGRQLEEWTRNEIDKLNGRRKSINLPSGMVGLRTVGPTLRVDDEQSVIDWATTHCPSAVQLIRKLSRIELKRFCEQTGEIPDAGVRVEPGGERFYVK